MQPILIKSQSKLCVDYSKKAARKILSLFFLSAFFNSTLSQPVVVDSSSTIQSAPSISDNFNLTKSIIEADNFVISTSWSRKKTEKVRAFDMGHCFVFDKNNTHIYSTVYLKYDNAEKKEICPRQIFYTRAILNKDLKIEAESSTNLFIPSKIKDTENERIKPSNGSVLIQNVPTLIWRFDDASGQPEAASYRARYSEPAALFSPSKYFFEQGGFVSAGVLPSAGSADIIGSVGAWVQDKKIGTIDYFKKEITFQFGYSLNNNAIALITPKKVSKIGARGEFEQVLEYRVDTILPNGRPYYRTWNLYITGVVGGASGSSIIGIMYDMDWDGDSDSQKFVYGKVAK